MSPAGSVACIEAPPAVTDEAWIEALRADEPARGDAVARLHELLLRAARFEVGRRRAALSFVRGEELDDVAVQAADDALVAVLAKLDDFRGASRFTTWAYKFALLEAGVRLRRRAWQEREVVLDADGWRGLADAAERPDVAAERRELLDAIGDCIATELTPHQRQVLVALAIDGVPIDVLAERLTTTRGALYKTLHDARRRLRARLAERGLTPERERPMARPDDDPTLARLLGPAEPEILCDECFERLDEFVDAEVRSPDADAAVPGMRAHLAGCPACAEEYESLRALVQRDG